MQARVHTELYRSFLELVAGDVQHERRAVNRRMLSVFVWCFLAPIVVSLVGVLLIRTGILSRGFRPLNEWVVLAFPLGYSIYVLIFEVVAELPALLRRGGIASTLDQALREHHWRDRVSDLMKRQIGTNPVDWAWICSNFQTDLRWLQHRTRYITALSGAVLFLIMKGLGSFSESAEDNVEYVRHPVLGWVQLSHGSEVYSLLGLALFLLLLYLSGLQTARLLGRYLDCADLIRNELEGQQR